MLKKTKYGNSSKMCLQMRLQTSQLFLKSAGMFTYQLDKNNSII